jgi:NAD(P)-dependent dehydrogenase (short-subunit alcohol dehydrogenase family)
VADAPVVVITGAASGIGRALARRYARSGARLGLLDRDASGLDEVVAELAETAANPVALVCDVGRWEDCKSAIEAVVESCGGIDVLINNAGITHLSPFADTDVDVVRRVMDVNFFGALYCTKAALESLVARRGLLIALSSVAGFSPLAGRCAYSASKHALHGLFETLRSEQRGSGLDVMMVCPSFTRTRPTPSPATAGRCARYAASSGARPNRTRWRTRSIGRGCAAAGCSCSRPWASSLTPSRVSGPPCSNA